jgi:hypothetical protein
VGRGYLSAFVGDGASAIFTGCTLDGNGKESGLEVAGAGSSAVAVNSSISGNLDSNVD